MRRLVLYAILAVGLGVAMISPVPAAAQEILKLDKDFACAAEAGATVVEATLFPSTEAASRALREIVDYVGLSAERIDLRASDVANAVAYLDPLTRRRLILYNEDFVRRLKNQSRSAWVARAILAHELAHHLNNHLEVATPDRRRVEELEADRFAGHVLFKMGADLEAVTAVFAELREGGAYPSGTARKAAATNGWWIAKEQGGYPGKDSTAEKTKPEEEPTVPRAEPVAAPPRPSQRVDGFTLLVQQVPFAAHAGGLAGAPGLAFIVRGTVHAPKGSNVQIVVTFMFADGRGALFPHPQEPHYRGFGNLLATGSPPIVMASDTLDLANVYVNTIPYYSLNLVPTGYQNTYPITALAQVLINGSIVASASPAQFNVQW